MQSLGSQGARCLFFLAIVSLCAIGNPANVRAQLVADGSTNVLDGIITNFPGTLTVGSNGSFTLLVITNKAIVTNRYESRIGLNSSARNNAAVVTGSGSVWGSLFLSVGVNGSSNTLSIYDGALVTDDDGKIGENPFSSNNVALVSGSGSLWTNNYQLLLSGKGNQLVVSNGGAVATPVAFIGGYAKITGTGSVLKTTSSLLGFTSPLEIDGIDGRLHVEKGGTVTNAGTCTVGHHSRGSSILLSDAGTSFRNGNDFLLGNGSASNLLAVSNGATFSAPFISVADNFGSNNTVMVTGPDSLITNQTDFLLGSVGFSNLLIVSDGGTLVARTGYVGSAFSSRGNQALITGPNSLWTNRSELHIGFGSQNQLIISNEAKVASYSSYIKSSSNTVVVTGAGSLWTNHSALYVNWSTSLNRLFITNGGMVICPNSFIGGNSVNAGSRVVIADPGSVWKCLSTFSFGYDGSGGNQLIISNSGALLANDLSVRGGPFGFNVLVSGGTVIATNFFSLYHTFGDYPKVLTLDSGLISAGSFGLNDVQFNFNGGTVQSRNTYWTSTNSFKAGNGSFPATFELLSSGSHSFPAGLIISSNATLKGVGTVSADVAVSAGGTLSPGSSIGQVSIYGGLVFSEGSTNLMELDSSAGTCDSLVGMTNLVYGGTLLIANLGGVLTDGNSFRLFSASNYSGAFSAIIPTSPGPGLKWNTNELNVDGVLRVFALQSPPPSIAAVQVSGANIQIQASGGIPYDPCFLLSTTNVASPVSWEIWSTNTFDSTGHAIFNPAISLGETARFFKLMIAD